MDVLYYFLFSSTYLFLPHLLSLVLYEWYCYYNLCKLNGPASLVLMCCSTCVCVRAVAVDYSAPNTCVYVVSPLIPLMKRYTKVFDEKASTRFPQARKGFDHKIEMKPEFKPKDCKLYPLAPNECVTIIYYFFLLYLDLIYRSYLDYLNMYRWQPDHPIPISSPSVIIDYQIAQL